MLPYIRLRISLIITLLVHNTTEQCCALENIDTTYLAQFADQEVDKNEFTHMLHGVKYFHQIYPKTCHKFNINNHADISTAKTSSPYGQQSQYGQTYYARHHFIHIPCARIESKNNNFSRVTFAHQEADKNEFMLHSTKNFDKIYPNVCNTLSINSHADISITKASSPYTYRQQSQYRQTYYYPTIKTKHNYATDQLHNNYTDTSQHRQTYNHTSYTLHSLQANNNIRTRNYSYINLIN
eukprot:269817_1